MDKTRALPVLATAAIALSLAACSGMGGREASGGGGGGSAQTSSTMPATTSTRSAAAEQQAAAPDLVRDVQRTLGARGYDAGQPDGVYGNTTEQALRRFQRDQRLNATGQIDAQTLAALGVTGEARAGERAATGSQYTPTTRRQGAAAPESYPSRRVSSADGMRGEDVRHVQRNLSDRGYDPGAIDGRWGPRTQAALRDFQRDQNLAASGRPDAQTMAALGVETGSPATQTGQLPAERGALPPSERSTVSPSQRGALPPQENPSGVDLQQRDVENPTQEQGLLPPTGSQAPGSARESERAPVSPGGAPDTRINPPEESQQTPEAPAGSR